MTGQKPFSHSADAALVHEALLYRGPAQLQDAIRGFLTDAAAAGEPVMIALPGEHLTRVRTGLGAAGRGARFEDMSVLGRNPSRVLPAIQEWVDTGTGRCRVVSEAVWPGRSHAEVVECLRHEALCNHALAGSPLTLLCPFDAENLDAEALAGAELTHPRLVEDGHRRASRHYDDPLRTAVAAQWPLENPVPPVSEYRFAGDLHALRDALAHDPVAASLDALRRGDLVFATNEAVTNVVKHGDGHAAMRLWSDGDAVVSEVSCESRIDDVMAGRRRPTADAAAGRGLWLINQVCDLVELRSGAAGTTLRMHIRAA
jgi:anti-sigma regulatory factor (Ser/Thr protein kinase)